MLIDSVSSYALLRKDCSMRLSGRILEWTVANFSKGDHRRVQAERFVKDTVDLEDRIVRQHAQLMAAEIALKKLKFLLESHQAKAPEQVE